MSSPHVLRIRQKNRPDGHLLVLINPKGKTPKTLDLELTGTDRVNLFRASIKDASTKSLQAENSSGSLEEWKAILAFALLRIRPDGPLPDFLQGVEIVAEIAESTLTITIRRIVGRITTSLGNVRLEEFDEEIDLLEWVDCAASDSDQLRSQLQAFQESSTEQQNQISKLTAELDDLVKAKKEHESDLLIKFAALLNEKKLKIRDQQRLLSHAKIDPDAAEEVRSSRTAKQSRKTARPSTSKRKAIVDEDDEEDVKAEDEDGTPTASEPETTDDEDDGGFAPAPPASQSSNAKSSAGQQPYTDMDKDMPLPPRRELPFQKRAPTTSAPAVPASSSTSKPAEETDESTDDEL